MKLHPVIATYLALADLGTMTESEGRERVKAMWPEYASQVDSLVEDFKAQALDQSPMNQRIRNQFDAMRQGSLIPAASENMSGAIRRAANRGRLEMPGDA